MRSLNATGLLLYDAYLDSHLNIPEAVASRPTLV